MPPRQPQSRARLCEIPEEGGMEVDSIDMVMERMVVCELSHFPNEATCTPAQCLGQS